MNMVLSSLRISEKGVVDAEETDKKTRNSESGW